MKNPGSPSRQSPVSVFLLFVIQTVVCAHAVSADFAGSISAVEGRPGAMAGLIYTVGTNFLRIAQTETNYPSPIDVVDLSSGRITLIQPMNNTFVRFTPGIQPPPPPHAYHPPVGAEPPLPLAPAGIGPTNFSGMPNMPNMPPPPAGLPPGIGPQSQGANVLPMPAAAPMVPMPARMPPGAGLELRATGATTNLFGYSCEQYEIARGDQFMEIWATGQLPPFQNYLATQPHRFAPPMIEEQWAGLVTAKKLFPLSAVLQTREGVEQYRFEVQSVTPHGLTTAETDGFEPPKSYVELQPHPF
jgi:hypothetical protein